MTTEGYATASFSPSAVGVNQVYWFGMTVAFSGSNKFGVWNPQTDTGDELDIQFMNGTTHYVSASVVSGSWDLYTPDSIYPVMNIKFDVQSPGFNTYTINFNNPETWLVAETFTGTGLVGMDYVMKALPAGVLVFDGVCIIGSDVGFGVFDVVGFGVAAGVPVFDGVAVAVGVFVAVGVAAGVPVFDGVAVAVGVPVFDGVAVAVGVFVAVGVAVGVFVAVGVALCVLVTEGVAFDVVGFGVAAGVPVFDGVCIIGSDVGFGVFDVVGFGVAAGVLVFDGVCIIGSDVGFGVFDVVVVVVVVVAAAAVGVGVGVGVGAIVTGKQIGRAHV